MAASTLIRKKRYPIPPDEYESRGDIALGVYATNGVAVTPAMFGLKTLRELRVASVGRSGAGVNYSLITDFPNLKIKAYVALTDAETANAVDLSTVVVPFTARGTG